MPSFRQVSRYCSSLSSPFCSERVRVEWLVAGSLGPTARCVRRGRTHWVVVRPGDFAFACAGTGINAETLSFLATEAKVHVEIKMLLRNGSAGCIWAIPPSGITPWEWHVAVLGRARWAQRNVFSLRALVTVHVVGVVDALVDAESGEVGVVTFPAITAFGSTLIEANSGHIKHKLVDVRLFNLGSG